jgi:hypothetical protein
MKKLALSIPGGPGGSSVNIPDPTSFSDRPVTDLISELISQYVFYLAGLVLLLYLVWGGLEILTSGGNPESLAKGKGKLTHAIIGFVIIFVSYWIIQLLEYILGVTILG